jgi:hypothetical protein
MDHDTLYDNNHVKNDMIVYADFLWLKEDGTIDKKSYNLLKGRPRGVKINGSRPNVVHIRYSDKQPLSEIMKDSIKSTFFRSVVPQIHPLLGKVVFQDRYIEGLINER